MNMCNDKNSDIKIEIHSWDSISQRAKEPFENAMLISVGDPEAPPPRLIYKPQHSLRLVFDDMTLEDAIERIEIPKNIIEDEEKLPKFLKRNYIELYSTALANKTAEFIKKNINNVDLIICQCEYGQSRSAAIAAAILEWHNSSGTSVFKDNRYSPNKWVYDKLLTALNNV